MREAVWLQELHEKRVTLIEGTALSERDLVRARAESTGAILLLADRFSADAKQEDLSVQFQVGLFPAGARSLNKIQMLQ